MLPFIFFIGILIYFVIRVVIRAFYTVKPNERAVLTAFGRAKRFGDQLVADLLMNEEEQARYQFPRLQVVGPGGPYFKWPWEEVHKVDVATQALDLTWDPTKRQTTIEAVTKDNLTTGVNGQIRFRVSEGNLYAYCFGVADPCSTSWATSSRSAGAHRQFLRSPGATTRWANRVEEDGRSSARRL